MTVEANKLVTRRMLPWLYLGNAAVLIPHEIDSAHWHERELFRLPGGIQGFLGANLVVVIVVLAGHRAVVRGWASGVVFSWVLVGQWALRGHRPRFVPPPRK